MNLQISRLITVHLKAFKAKSGHEEENCEGNGFAHADLKQQGFTRDEEAYRICLHPMNDSKPEQERECEKVVKRTNVKTMIALRIKWRGGRPPRPHAPPPFPLPRFTLPLSGLEYRVTCKEHERTTDEGLS